MRWYGSKNSIGVANESEVIAIKDLEAITEYRKRRDERAEQKRLDDEWITMRGTHVMIDDGGSVTKGPDRLKNLPRRRKSEMTVGEEMRPINSDYDYEDGDGEEEFTRKNIKKLKKIYDDQGIEAVHDEWYKFRMANSTKDIHQISKDEADEVMFDNVRQSIYDGWFRAADSSYKPQLTSAVVKNQETRNAALNLAYENYRNNTDNPLSFEEFLVTPIKMYRGEKGQKHVEDDVFDAYTFDKKMAEHFAGSGGTVTEAEIRPIDTYGSMRAVGEAEIWVPRQLSPVGFKGDERDDGITWERYNPVKWALEDYAQEESPWNDPIDSIIRDAEMVKLFADNGEETGKKILSRCFDSIRKSVLQLTAMTKATNNDGAFFAGELDDNLGEKYIEYPEHVTEFQNRRKERLDAKRKARIDGFRARRQKRLDAKKDDLEWITVNGAHIPIDDDGDLKGEVGNEIERHAEEAEEKKASAPKKESSSKHRVNASIEEIINSDKSYDEKTDAIRDELQKLPAGSKITMPDSWQDEDGKNPVYIFDGESWREKGHGWGLSCDDMATYMNEPNAIERPKVTSVARDPESIEASRKKREESKDYAMNPDGSIGGKYTKDFHNNHVTQEERDSFSKEIKDMVDYEKGWDDSRSLYRNEANRVGGKIADEIKRRAALRRGDKENCPINGNPQVEDIYDVLKDMRDFGMPEGFNPTVNSDLPKERTDAIVKEAFDRFPTDWLKDAKSKPIINIIDGPGRAICLNDGYINVYTQKDLGLSSGELTTLNDRALVNDLAHELGHYIEWNNQKVQYSARDCLWERGKDSEIIEVEPGYDGYKDSFFNPYMGKIYSHGGTEIISMLMGNIGCFDPFSVLEGHEYDYSKGKYDGRKKRDKESLGYALGVLAGL